MTPAVAYIRVSSSKQLNGDGPERQLESILRFANGRHSILQSFTDDVTGSRDDVSRPGWNNMLAYCKQCAIGTILIEKIDRLQREPIVGELLLAQCRDAGIALIDCSTGMNFAQESDDPYIRFLQRILRDAAAFNKDVMVYHTRKARQRIRERDGKCEGRKGYGDTAQWLPVVTDILRMRQSGMGAAAIANHLNDNGVQTMRGGPWKRGTVDGILQNAERRQ